jgi:O-antigen/teichoic acid export membrane protein
VSAEITTPETSPRGPAATAVYEDPGPARGGGVGRDIAITGLTQVSIAVGGLLLYRLLSTNKGAEGVAAYSLVKQLVVFLWPLVMVGSQTAIPRYIALARDRSEAPESYLLGALTLTGAATAPICLFALLWPHTTAALAFGHSDRTYLVVPLIATLASTVLLEVTYGYYRGQSNFKVGNAVRVVFVAAFPVVLLLTAADRPIGTLILSMAVAVLAACAVVLARPLARAVRTFKLGAVLSATRSLLNYGYRRIPGDAAAVVLFAVPTVLAAHYAPLSGVAYLSTGLYVLAVVTIAFQPIGLVFLPILSRLCASDFEAARRFVAQLATCSIHIALFVTPQLILFADIAVRAWLGSAFKDAGSIIRIAVFPAGVFVLNVILRSALDAAAVTAYNARNNVASLLVAAVAVTVSLATGVATPLECIAGSFALGILTLGLLTLVSIQRVFRLNAADYSLPVAVALATAAAGLGCLVRFAAVGDEASAASVGAIAGLELALGGLYLLGLTRFGVAWPSEIRARLRRRS